MPIVCLIHVVSGGIVNNGLQHRYQCGIGVNRALEDEDHTPSESDKFLPATTIRDSSISTKVGTLGTTGSPNETSLTDKSKRAYWLMECVDSYGCMFFSMSFGWLAAGVVISATAPVASAAVLGVSAFLLALATLAKYFRDSGSSHSAREGDNSLLLSLMNGGEIVESVHGPMFDLRAMLSADTKLKRDVRNIMNGMLDDAGLSGAAFLTNSDIDYLLGNKTFTNSVPDDTGHLLWVYGNGTVVSVSGRGEHGHEDFVSDVAEFTKSYYNATGNDKRWVFKADWASYTYNNVNHDLANQWYGKEHTQGIRLRQLMTDAFRQYDGYKYCLTPHWNALHDYDNLP